MKTSQQIIKPKVVATQSFVYSKKNPEIVFASDKHYIIVPEKHTVQTLNVAPKQTLCKKKKCNSCCNVIKILETLTLFK